MLPGSNAGHVEHLLSAQTGLGLHDMLCCADLFCCDLEEWQDRFSTCGMQTVLMSIHNGLLRMCLDHGPMRVAPHESLEMRGANGMLSNGMSSAICFAREMTAQARCPMLGHVVIQQVSRTATGLQS